MADFFEGLKSTFATPFTSMINAVSGKYSNFGDFLTDASPVTSLANYLITGNTSIIDQYKSTLNNGSTSNSGSEYPEGVLENNSFIEYLEGLLASQGQEAVENRLYNMIEAEKNREWQMYMSNTSYQRAVADLQKAGLNPILAGKVTGATTPTGSTASMSSTSGDTLSSLIRALSSLISSVSSNKSSPLLKLLFSVI